MPDRSPAPQSEIRNQQSAIPPAFNPAFIRQAVADLGSAAELARLLGVSKESVSLWCEGRNAPAQSHIDLIASELGLPPESAWLEPPELTPDRVRLLADRVLHNSRIGTRRLHDLSAIPLGTCSELRNDKRQPNPAQLDILARIALEHMPSVSKRVSSSWAAAERARRSCRRSAMNLSDDVLKFFGLSDDPWRLDVRCDGDVFLTRDFGRVHKLISRAVERRDFAVVAAPTGAGKTDMSKRVLNEIRKRRSVRLVEVFMPDVKQLSSAALCDALVLNLAPGTKGQIRTEKLAVQVVEILREHRRQGVSPVIIIDDAHQCTISVLRQLKRFWQFRSPESYEPLLGIILLGWPVLPLTLHNNPELLEVARRADIVELRGLHGEHADYIQRKLHRVGGNGQVFDGPALRAFGSVPQAQWPLPTNRIASRSMRLAFDLARTRPEKQRGLVLADDVRQAAQEVV